MSATQVQVYHRPHKAYASETAFGKVLVQSLGAQQISSGYPVSEKLLRHAIDTRLLHARLAREDLLPERARTRCMDALCLLPERVLAARGPFGLSHDFVVVKDDIVTVVEFHETQRRQLTVNRPVPLFDGRGKEYRVPRCLQRLVRDVWRVEVIENLVIVWYDWFEQNEDSFRLPLAGGLREFAAVGRFSLGRFCRD